MDKHARFQFTVHRGRFLLIVATGHARLCDLLGLVDLTFRVAESEGYGRVLLDLLSVVPELSFCEHMTLGIRAAAALDGLEKVASVLNPDFRSGTSEMAAQKSGLALRTFTDLHEATDWISAN